MAKGLRIELNGGEISEAEDCSIIDPTTDEQVFTLQKACNVELSWWDAVCYRNHFYWDQLEETKKDERLQYRENLISYYKSETILTDTFPSRPTEFM